MIPTKWQFFAGGFLLGVILSGLFLLLLSQMKNPTVTTIIALDATIQSKPSIVTSLPSNQGKININTATIEELTALPGVGPSKAAAIIDFREKYGQFEDIEELLYVPGLGESLFSTIKEFIAVE